MQQVLFNLKKGDILNSLFFLCAKKRLTSAPVKSFFSPNSIPVKLDFTSVVFLNLEYSIFLFEKFDLLISEEMKIAYSPDKDSSLERELKELGFCKIKIKEASTVFSAKKHFAKGHHEERYDLTIFDNLDDDLKNTFSKNSKKYQISFVFNM